VHDALVAQGMDGSSRVEITSNLPELGSDDIPQIKDVKFNAAGNSFTGKLTSTATKRDYPLYGRTVVTMSVPAVNHAIKPGEMVTKEDIVWIDVDANKLGYRAVTSEDQIVGKKAERPITPQVIVRSNMIASPVLVKKNSLITVYYTTEALNIAQQFRALDDGAMGETIRALNSRSNKTIDVVVSGSDQATVNPAQHLAAK
jgi:flagella basal body P-ring formation protein FlgA